MGKVIINKKTLEDFVRENDLKVEDKDLIIRAVTSSSDAIEVETNELSVELIKYIVLNDSRLDNESKTMLSLELLESNSIESSKLEDDLWDTKINYLSDIFAVYSKIKKQKFNADYEYLGRRYPVKMMMELKNATRYLPRHIRISIELIAHKNAKRSVDITLNNDQVIDLKKRVKKLTFRVLMSIFNFYEQKENIEDYLQKLSKVKSLQQQSGKHILCSGTGMTFSFGTVHWDNFGQKSAAIIENELEVEAERNHYVRQDEFKHKTELPYVRVFSLFYKDYFLVHIDDISDYEYDKKAFERLILPSEMKNTIQKIFSYSLQNLTGDIISYKHGGLIVMAEGNPGVGKTSTAEVYSELNQKPLYVIQADELFDKHNSFEKNLSIIFRRVEKWNAVILFDEVDIFLYERGSDVWQASKVGVFLRLMDYFRGIMFLTTNRSDVIDHAVLSRITVNIAYPDLNKKTRKAIWVSKLKEAGMTIDSTDKLAELELNGRQIRNMVRLGGIMFDKKIKEVEFIELIKKSVPNYKEEFDNRRFTCNG